MATISISPIAILNAATATVAAGDTIASVFTWMASKPKEFDLEVWCGTTSTNLSLAEIYALVPHPAVVADQAVTSVANASDTFTRVAHGFVTGDGPFQYTTSGTLPAGMALATNYWIIKLTADTYKLATSLENALLGTPLNITSDGTGTHTLVDTADTQQIAYHSHGVLGAAGSGNITLTSRRAYTVRCAHHTRAVGYTLSATFSAAGPVSAAICPVAK